MALFDEKFYLEVVQGYMSDETKKARRNLSVTAFIISVIFLLEFKLQDLKIFGLSMEKQSSNALAWIAMGLLTYWILVYIVQLFTDKHVNKEKETQLSKDMATIQEGYDQLRIEQRERENAKNSKRERPKISESEIDRQIEIKTEYEAYSHLLDRTSAMRISLYISKLIHKNVPFALSVFAYYALIRMLLC